MVPALEEQLLLCPLEPQSTAPLLPWHGFGSLWSKSDSRKGSAVALFMPGLAWLFQALWVGFDIQKTNPRHGSDPAPWI